MLSIDSYGLAKRVKYIKRTIERLKPKVILEFGCGTGNNVLAHLAELFPDIGFVGVDSDCASIEYARKNHKARNLVFELPAALEHYPRFDLIIATEVIEHVEEPDCFLRYLKEQLTKDGRLILTLPNGYGPFEMASMIEGILHLTGILPVIRKVKLAVNRPRPGNTWRTDTLAISPHINFFSTREIRRLIGATGFKIVHQRPRTFLCGFGFDTLLRGQAILSYNARVADYLPQVCTSGWMFLLEKQEEMPPGVYRYQRTFYARWRKYLNLKRWKVK